MPAAVSVEHPFSSEALTALKMTFPAFTDVKREQLRAERMADTGVLELMKDFSQYRADLYSGSAITVSRGDQYRVLAQTIGESITNLAQDAQPEVTSLNFN